MDRTWVVFVVAVLLLGMGAVLLAVVVGSHPDSSTNRLTRIERNQQTILKHLGLEAAR